MNRSNPTDSLPNPATRWFEWNGETGNPKYYDKELEKTVQVDLPFEFILLDRLAVIKGWHSNSESGITSNEVRDTRKETLFVRAFKLKEPIAEGFYSDIKDKVKANGGRFALNCYIAYTNDQGDLDIGSMVMGGVARNAWFEFENDKTVRLELYKKAIRISGKVHGEKGAGKKKIEWESPIFELTELPPHINDKATELDKVVQDYLRSYFKRTRVEQAEPVATDHEEQPIHDRTDHEPVGAIANGDEPEVPF